MRLKKFQNQMPLSKTVAIESNSNLQFVIAAFELLNEKTLLRTTTFAKHTSLGISLVEKLNSSFFPHKYYFGLKLITTCLVEGRNSPYLGFES